jgi:hypothetical protein
MRERENKVGRREGGPDSNDTEQGPPTGCCENGNELLGFITTRHFEHDRLKGFLGLLFCLHFPNDLCEPHISTPLHDLPLTGHATGSAYVMHAPQAIRRIKMRDKFISTHDI